MVNEIKSSPVETCMVCGSKGKPLYRGLNDRLFGTSKNWNISTCSNDTCGLLWLNPMPVREEIWKAYASYYTHTKQQKSWFFFPKIEKAYQHIKYGYYPELKNTWIGYLAYLMPVFRNQYDFNVLFLKSTDKGRMLDFGCGNGWLMDNLTTKGWDCYGLDFDEKSVAYCTSNGLKVKVGDIASQNYPDGYFDAITINHVIEHVYDVDVLISDAFKVLKKGGSLIIATPNTANWQHGVYKDQWFQLDPPRHLHLFNNKNLETIVKRNGFSIDKSFSSIRMDAWSTIVSRGVIRKGSYILGKDKKTKLDLIIGICHQYISWVIQFFNNKKAGEIIIIAKK
ncbi:MAG: class I SAM-dependent methyltransferase [Cytophagaceae bacterium]